MTTGAFLCIYVFCFFERSDHERFGVNTYGRGLQLRGVDSRLPVTRVSRRPGSRRARLPVLPPLLPTPSRQRARPANMRSEQKRARCLICIYL